MLALPLEFQKRMKNLLGQEYEAFEACYEKPGFRAVRVNPLKCSADLLRERLEFPLTPAPFSTDSYYIPEQTDGLGRHPFHHAGAFYVQEPSAASAVTVLAPAPGDRVLDLCAAPGGKSTQIAGALQGKGLLWSNEIVRNRAQVLLSNMERMGVRNAVVSSCRPDLLCGRLAGYFDKVLVDAPCSGEGMFRREPQAVAEWSLAHTEACAERQLAILNSAAQAVREGGVLVYSTCTFAPVENEGVVSAFLREHPGFVLEETGLSGGREGLPSCGDGSPSLLKTRRIYPMDGGEGHFVAKMRCLQENPCAPATCDFAAQKKPEHRMAEELYEELFVATPYGSIVQVEDKFLLLPHELPELSGLGVLRAGVLLGQKKKNRLEPEHALFMAAKPQECRQKVELYLEDTRLYAYLHGEEIEVPEEIRGFAAVMVEGMTVGFGKASGGVLKNRYPKGLRNLK